MTISKDIETHCQYGNGYAHTGNWCKDCRDKLVSKVINDLDELGLVERYEIDHSGKDKTVEHYKNLLK